MTSYNYEQMRSAERGWVFYDAAWKCLREIYQQLKPGQTALDVGCGGGVMMGLIKALNPTVDITGFEGQHNPVWAARGLNVVTGSDICALPFYDKSFDVVYTSHVLEHLKEPEKLIAESLRIARDYVIHIVPDGDVSDRHGGETHLHTFNRVSYLKLFDDYKVLYYRPILDLHLNALVAVVSK